jgi:calcium-dependent protein kinase
VGEGSVKLIDFGLSRACLEADTMTQDVGSVVYKAPEVSAGAYSQSSDMWSFGVMLHMLVAGIVPWQGDSRTEIEASIKQECAGDLKGFLAWFYTAMGASAECTDFICNLLTVDVGARFTCAQARDHPFLSGQGAVGSESASGGGVARESISLHMAEKLQAFRTNNRLKRTALLAVSFGADSAQLQRLEAAFCAADTNNDGLLDIDEFTAAMRSHGMDDSDEIEALFAAVNQDGTGKVKYSEFVAAELDPAHYQNEGQIEAAFKRLDFDGDGSISRGELELLLVDAWGKGAAAEAASIISEADTNSDGVIDYSEFKAAMFGAATKAPNKTSQLDQARQLLRRGVSVRSPEPVAGHNPSPPDAERAVAGSEGEAAAE